MSGCPTSWSQNAANYGNNCCPPSYSPYLSAHSQNVANCIAGGTSTSSCIANCMNNGGSKNSCFWKVASTLWQMSWLKSQYRIYSIRKVHKKVIQNHISNTNMIHGLHQQTLEYWEDSKQNLTCTKSTSTCHFCLERTDYCKEKTKGEKEEERTSKVHGSLWLSHNMNFSTLLNWFLAFFGAADDSNRVQPCKI
jgi:hypothetical protein